MEQLEDGRSVVDQSNCNSFTYTQGLSNTTLSSHPAELPAGSAKQVRDVAVGLRQPGLLHSRESGPNLIAQLGLKRPPLSIISQGLKEKFKQSLCTTKSVGINLRSGVSEQTAPPTQCQISPPPHTCCLNSTRAACSAILWAASRASWSSMLPVPEPGGGPHYRPSRMPLVQPPSPAGFRLASRSVLGGRRAAQRMCQDTLAIRRLH